MKCTQIGTVADLSYPTTPRSRLRQSQLQRDAASLEGVDILSGLSFRPSLRSICKTMFHITWKVAGKTPAMLVHRAVFATSASTAASVTCSSTAWWKGKHSLSSNIFFESDSDTLRESTSAVARRVTGELGSSRAPVCRPPKQHWPPAAWCRLTNVAAASATVKSQGLHRDASSASESPTLRSARAVAERLAQDQAGGYLKPRAAEAKSAPVDADTWNSFASRGT